MVIFRLLLEDKINKGGIKQMKMTVYGKSKRTLTYFLKALANEVKEKNLIILNITKKL